ncbi:MAG: GLUG motif-containing protein, partial [Hominilimicola sp.]
IARDTKIENCYSNTVVLADEYVGGLVGQLLSGSKVTNCYATGTVKAKKAGTLFGAFTNGVSAENLYYRIIGDKMPYGENASTNTNIATGRTDEHIKSDAQKGFVVC